MRRLIILPVILFFLASCFPEFDAPIYAEATVPPPFDHLRFKGQQQGETHTFIPRIPE